MEPINNCYCCPHDPGRKDEHTNAYSILQYLCCTLEDEEGQTLVRRQLFLTYHYLNVKNDVLNIEEIPYLSAILEFYTCNLKSTPDYYKPLACLLSICQRPIIKNKTSDSVRVDVISDFFTSLGTCLVFSKGNDVIQAMVLDVICHIFNVKKIAPHEIPISTVYEAAKESSLVDIADRVMRESNRHTYNGILEVIYQLSYHCSCAKIFLELGCVDYCLKKLKFSNVLNSNDANMKEITSNLLWALLRPRDNKNKDQFESSPQISLSSLICLREWFRRDIMYGKSYERNNIAALILQVILFFPDLEIVKSRILQDICLIATAWDFGTENTWATGLKLGYLHEDMTLRKILITIICYNIKHTMTCMAATDYGFVTSLAHLLDINDEKWSSQNKKELLIYSLHSLPIVVDHLPTDYIKSGATSRILSIIDHFSDKQKNLQIVKTSCECLQAMIAKSSLIQHFKKLNVLSVLISLLNSLLKNCKLTLLAQSIIDSSCHALSDIVHCDQKLLEKYSQELEQLSILLLRRLQKPDQFDSKIENSLLIGAGIMVWNSVILNPTAKNSFVTDNGIYMVLDIIEGAAFSVQVFYLGILADFCFDRHCVPQIITWRGKKINTNTLSLLCKIWRTQEDKKKVLRDDHHCIEDIECSLMGKKQREIEITCFSNSPALVDMVGCARPKIAAIVHFLTRRYHDHAQLARSVYLIPYEVLSTEDQVSLEVIKYYEELKEGEVFWEIQQVQEKTNAILLPLDLTVVHNLVMRNVGWANCIQQRQRAIINMDIRKDVQEEEKLYNDFRETEMVKTLNRLKQVHYYMKLSDGEYRKRVIAKRKKLLGKLEKDVIPGDHYHRTFSNPRDFAMIKSGKMPITKTFLNIKSMKQYSTENFH